MYLQRLYHIKIGPGINHAFDAQNPVLCCLHATKTIVNF